MCLFLVLCHAFGRIFLPCHRGNTDLELYNIVDRIIKQIEKPCNLTYSHSQQRMMYSISVCDGMSNPSYNSDGVSPLVVCSIHGAANVMLRVQGKRERFSQRRI